MIYKIVLVAFSFFSVYAALSFSDRQEFRWQVVKGMYWGTAVGCILIAYAIQI